MKALSKFLGIALILLAFNGFSQCTLNLFSTPDSVVCGNCVTLSAFGSMNGNVAFQEDFNSGSPVGWQFTQTTTIANNTCGVPSPDGTPFMWMGNASVNPRNMTTVPFNLTLGGTICFEMRYAIQGDASPCEGPDLPDEGVFLQYSNDGGVTWITINYWDPNGGNDPYLTTWHQYCAAIPAGAMTPNTMIQWHQNAVSGADYDHWGIDNVIITLNDPNAVITWLHDGYSYPTGSSGGDDPTQVCLRNDSTFTAQITNGTNTCTQTITIGVKSPVVVVSALPDTTLCPGQCAQLTGIAKVVVSPASTPTFSNAEIGLIFGNPALPCTSFGGCTCADGSTASFGQNCAGSFDANMDINVQGLNNTTLSATSITSVCISNYAIIAGSCTGLSLADVEIVLISPGGSTVILAPRGTLTGTSISNMCFQLGATNYSTSTSPYTGTFAPANSWTSLNGTPSNGVWRLELRGANSALCMPTGSIDGWSISFDDPEINYLATYNWSPTTNMTNATTLTPTVCPSATQTYTLQATDANNCVTVSDPVTVTVSPCVNCAISALTAVPGACVPSSNNYTVTGQITFNNAPTSGTLTVTDCHGGTQIFNAPFTSPQTYSITGNTSDGNACNVTAVFSADTACTLTTNYTAPATCSVVCSISSLTATPGACQSSTNTYDLSGSITFSNAPTTGTLTVTECNGSTQTFNAPFTSPQAYNITGLISDGLACSVTAVFSADASCSLTTNFSAPASCVISSCFFNTISDSIGICSGTTNLFPRHGEVTFTNPPTTGLLIFTDCQGIADTLYPPFVSPANYYMEPHADSSVSCNVTAVFTADPSCTISVPNNYPPACGCTAYVGTFSASITPNVGQNPYKLCYGDQFTLTSNGDNIDPSIATSPPISPPNGYNPGIGYLIYSCPPTLFPQNPLWAAGTPLDPCLIGVVGFGNSFSDINFLGGPSYAGTFTNNTVYYVPITFYDTINGYYSYTNTTTNCYSMGQPFAVQYLPQITSSSVANCQDSSVTVTLNGGLPQLDGSLFTATNLLPANAYFVNTTTTNGGTIVIKGLLNGDNYSFDVADTNGCPISITGGPFVGLPNAYAGVDDTICALTYALNAIPSFGTGSWSGSAGVMFSPSNSPTASVIVPSAGTYTFTWTENNTLGCTSTDSVVITFSNLSQTNTPVATTCGSANGSITITATGGLNPYQYSIDGGVTFLTSNVFNNLAANTYNIVVKDVVGCQITGSAVVPISNLPVINSLSTVNPLCNGDCNGSITVVASGGTGSIQYSIDGINFQASSSFNALCGATPYTITIADASACQVTKDTILIDPPLLLIDSIVTKNISCNAGTDGTINIYTSGGTGTISYSIDNGLTFVSTSSFTGLSVNTYNVVVKDANNCSANGTSTITAPLPLSIPEVVSNITCNGGNDGQVVVAPQGGTAPYNYSWTSGGNTPIESGLSAGSITVTVTDSNNCSLDSTFILTEPMPFTFTTASNNAFCNQPNGWATVVNFTGGTGSYTYNWNGSGATVNDTLFNLIPGNYTVIVTDAVGCDTTFSILVNNTPGFTANIISFTNAICKDSLNGTAIAGGSDPFATYSFNWYDAGNQSTAAVNNLGAGTYHVKVTDAATGCVDTTIVTIGEPSLVTVAASDVTICTAQTASLTATGANGNGAPYYYVWDNGAFTGSPYIVSPLTSTAYSVIAVDLLGCPSLPTTVNVTVTPPLTVVAGNDIGICPTESATISATGSFGNGGPYIYNWTNGGVGQSQTVTPTATTTYVVTLTDGCSPAVKDTIVVTVNPLPVVQLARDTFSLCLKPTKAFTFYNLTDTSNGMVGTVAWDFGDGTGSVSGSASAYDTVAYTYNTAGTYDVSLTVTATAAAGGCSSTKTENGFVEVYANPIADFSMNPNPTTMFQPQVNFFDQSMVYNPPLDQFWNFGNLATSILQDPTYLFPEDTGHYRIVLIVTDAQGCQDSTSQILIVKGEYGLYVPNAFTPDADNLNDGFYPKGFGISDKNYLFLIFDRWGEKIFESTTKFAAWDGTYKGKVVPNDVYVWKLYFSDINNEKHSAIGHVTIVK